MTTLAYNSVDVAYPYRIRGTNHQTDVGLAFRGPAVRLPGASLSSPTNTTQRAQGGLRCGGFSLHNRSGGAISVGIGVRIPNFLWLAGQWVNSTTTWTDDTTDAQDAGTSDFALETTTANTGFVILSRVPFNGISLNVGTASVDGAAARTRVLSYSSGTAGHTWATALTNLYQSDGAGADYATGEQVWVWALPVDHTPTTIDGSLGTNIPKGYYAVRVMATTAPDTTAGLATAIEIFRFFHLTEALADNGVYEAFYGASELRLESLTDQNESFGDAVVAYFGGTANVQNRLTGFFRAAG